MGRRGPSRSLFAALPHDLRTTIRTNGQYLSQNGLDLDSLQVKQESIDAGGSAPASRLLRTQPASVSPDREDEIVHIEAGPSVIASTRQAVSKGSKSSGVGPAWTNGGTAQAQSSGVRAVKRRRTEEAWVVSAGPSTIAPRQKRRKGKELPVYNAYEGHPWDCTGLVQRYVNRDHVPDDIKKCELDPRYAWIL